MMVELTRDLVEILIENVIVPSASSIGDVDGLTQTLKHGIVSYVLDCGDVRKEAAARIFSKSDRWIYRQLEEIEGRKERRRIGDDHAGYDLMVRVVQFYAQLYPREAPAQACVRALRRNHVNVVVQSLQPVLNLCVDQGYLTRVTFEVGDHQEVLYRAVSNGVVVGSAGDVRDRKLRVQRRVRSIFPILRSYLQGHPLSTFSMFALGLPEEKLRIFLDKSIEYMKTLVRELQAEVDAETMGERRHYEEFRVMILAGPGPFHDPIRPPPDES